MPAVPSPARGTARSRRAPAAPLAQGLEADHGARHPDVEGLRPPFHGHRDRRARKGDFRKLWIQRINAGARQHGMSYSRLINGLHLAGIEVDRKVLADLAVTDPDAFGALVRAAQDALSGAPVAEVAS